MLSLKTFFDQFVSRIVTLLFALAFSVSSLLSVAGGAPKKAPADFTPVIRFAVCSDVHLNGEADQPEALRFGKLFDAAYAYAASHDAYRSLDAVLVAGDFTAGGGDEEYEMFNQIVGAHKKPETQVLTVLGNHEFIRYRDYDASIGYEKFYTYIGEETDLHVVINGYHLIGVSYDKDGKHFKTKTDWLRGELDQAVKSSGEKPVFVFQHPHPTGTVYGSINWSDPDIRLVLQTYPQVVDFSGHSHYVPGDPRSIWQGAFTAVGTGALKAFMSNLSYTDSGTDAPGESAGFWIVEANADGNVRLQLYDLISDTFFSENDYYLTELRNPTKRQFTWGQQQCRDTAPRFPEGAAVSAFVNENGETVLCFPDAAGTFEAENYKITVTQKALQPVWSETVLSDYVRAGRNGMQVNLGMLPPGRYQVYVTAFSPYAKQGQTLRGEIATDAQM